MTRKYSLNGSFSKNELPPSSEPPTVGVGEALVAIGDRYRKHVNSQKN